LSQGDGMQKPGAAAAGVGEKIFSEWVIDGGTA
jgi:hypothetical protein